MGKCNCGRVFPSDIECFDGVLMDCDEHYEGWQTDVVYPPGPCNPKYCRDCSGTGDRDGGDCDACDGDGWLRDPEWPVAVAYGPAP